ncbi:hypothetical protein DACRYDRAFT_116977 [Dacryopinax primogenitus]|uniref:Uncharacterized protein n=1 Tax=Dacryopinax primogenitus (strain DJM 731) TaxID=1858805 RepID=M5GB64_DACPD|nr:uncharacterized protein DACRYDRAFT_116977 [Dacryopinax primogenitus]EJU01188.1 hypothetical protein DACRYDRAFT_116977 [Dacryopinax primogenitus]
MSLPIALKDISDKPQAGAVTDPVHPAQMQADIDRKLRLYGVVQAFRNGRMPTNVQINDALSYVEAHSPLDMSQLSAEGRNLIDDVRDIIETARKIVMEKNADELFQNFVWHTTYIDPNRGKVVDSLGDAVPVSQEQAKADAQQAVVHVRTLLSLFLTNAEARKLLSDVGLIGRDMFATGAANVAEKVRPDPEAMARVDDAAPSNQWKGADGRVHGPNETPVLQATLPGGRTVQAHPKEPLSNATYRDADGQERPTAEIAQQAQERVPVDDVTDREQWANAATNGARRNAEPHVRDVQGAVQRQPDDDGDAQVEAGKRTWKEKFNDFKANLNDRVPDEHKDKIREHRDAIKDHFKEQFPEERRDQFIWRMKKVVVENQKHGDYQETMNWFLNFLETYHGHAKSAVGTGSQSANALTEDPSLQLAWSEFRTLLERFANNRTMQPIIDAVNDLYNDAQQDEGLRHYFSRLDGFVRRTLLEPGYVLAPEYDDDARRVRDEGKQFFDEKYAPHKDRLFDSIQDFFLAMGDDPLNKQFGDDWARLTHDLLFDENGQLAFKPHLWGDIRRVILPSIVDQVGYVPIPRIEYTDDQMDLVIENLTLQGRNLLPNVIELEVHNWIKFSPYSTVTDDHHHSFRGIFGQIQADLRDVAFYFKKKQGFPKLSDSGVADVVIGGSGISGTVHVASAGKDKSSVFTVKDVHVKIDSLNFSIRDSKHDTLYKVLKPLATGLIKKQIAKALQDAIRTGLEYVDGELVGVRDRMGEAKAQDGVTRTDVPKQAFQRKKAEAQSVKEKTGEFKIDTTRDSMLLPNVGHEGGLINRQFERAEAAKRGKEWRSDAFSIVPQGSANRA